MLIGDGIFGSLFALGCSGGLRGGVNHLATDDTAWRPFGQGLMAFAAWCCSAEAAGAAPRL